MKEVADLEQFRNARHLKSHVVEPDLATLGQLVFFRSLNQSDGMMVRCVAEKNHAVFVPVREFKPHDFSPELAASLDIADAQHHVTDLFNLDGARLSSHRILLSFLNRYEPATTVLAGCLSRNSRQGRNERPAGRGCEGGRLTLNAG